MKLNKCFTCISRIAVTLLLTITISLCISINAKADTMYSDFDAETAYPYIMEQFKARNEHIDMTSYRIILDNGGGSSSSIETRGRKIVSATLQDNADTYMVDAIEVSTFKEDGKVYLDGYDVTYFEECDDQLFQEGVDRILSQITPEMTDVTKVLIVHDYMVLHKEYDMQNTYVDHIYVPTNFTAYGPIVYGTGVCEGNSLAFKYIMDQLGIECYLVHSEQLEHMWNMVIIDGEAYHVDVTFDDPGWDRVGRISHSNFLLSDEEMLDNHYPNDMKVLAHGEEIDIPATSIKFKSSTFRQTYSPFFYYDGNYYFTRRNYETGLNEVCSMNAEKISKWEVTLVKDIGTWYGVSDDDDVVSDWYGCVVKIENDRVYYTVPNGMDSVGIEKKDVREEYRVELEPDYEIYGIVDVDGELYYDILKGDDFLSGTEVRYQFKDEEKVYQEEEVVEEEPIETIEPEENEEPEEYATGLILPDDLEDDDDVVVPSTDKDTKGMNPAAIVGIVAVLIAVVAVVVVVVIIVVIVGIVKKSKKKKKDSQE